MVELIEVKPDNQTVKENLGRSRHNQLHYALNQAKWEAASKYAKSKGENAVHGSDSDENAAIEISFHFKNSEIFS